MALYRVPTGIESLNTVLNGGFPEGSTILIVGNPGTGKTILANQIAFSNASPDCKVLYLATLSEPQIKIMKFQQEFDFFDIEKFQNSVIYNDLGDIILKDGGSQIVPAIDELLQKYQPKIVILDTIRTLSEIIPSVTEFRKLILTLSLRFAVWGCTTFLLGEYEEDVIVSRPESAIADGIIYLSGTEEKKLQKRFLRILKMRGTGYVSGEIFFKISQNGIELFPRLCPHVGTQSYFENASAKISSGIEGLDEMLGGGIPKGSTTIITGASGCGKTSFALYFAYAGLKTGEKVVYMTFDENPGQLLNSAKSLNMDFFRYQESGQLEIIHISPVELDLDEHILQIQKKVGQSRPGRLIIDSISSFELGFTDKIKYTDYVWSLSDYLKVLGVSILMTQEIHHSGSSLGPTLNGLSYIMDNLVYLFYMEDGLDIKCYVRVVKVRGNRHMTKLKELVVNNGISLEDIDNE